jgi:MFS transporter, YQGE family, putative transporter
MKNRLAIELGHFRALSDAAQRLLVSFTLFEFVLPLVFTFVNAFILRNTTGLMPVVIYNVGFFASIAVHFYLNGLLFKYFSIKTLHIVGIIGQGIALNVVFWLTLMTLPWLFIFGVLQGVFVGLYWSNRLFLTMEVTSDQQRTYFTALEHVTMSLMEIMVPFSIGLVIALSKYTGLLSIAVTYKIIGILSMMVLFLTAWLFNQVELTTPQVPKYFLFSPSKSWLAIRLSTIIWGFQWGVGLVLPSILVFILIGTEGSLGTLQSLSAILMAAAMYVIARKLKVRQRLKLLSVSTWMFVGLVTLLAIFFNPVSAIIFLVLLGPVRNIMWVTRHPIVMSVIDQEDGGNSKTNYAYIADREFFLNIGRISGLALFVGLIFYQSEAIAVRVTPLVTGMAQLVMVWLMYKIEKLQSKTS